MNRFGADLFRGVFQAVPDAVVLVDADGVIVLANDQCHRVFGVAPEQLEGEPVDRLVPMRFRERHPRRRDGYGTAADPRPMGLLRLAAVRYDGTEFPAEISLAPIVSDGAHFVAATVRDITSRIREEERFRSLLEAAPDPTVIIDESATIVVANQRVGDVLGYTREHLVGQPLTTLASVPGPEELEVRIRRYLRDPSVVAMGYTQEFRIRHADGHDLPMEISLAPLRTHEGLLVSIALRDSTERMRLESESERMRDELIATVSHELRTPLTSIIGYSELMSDLEEEDLSDRARSLLAVIERNATRELRLVDDLLTVAYLEDNRLRIQCEPTDLVAVARRALQDAALRGREQGVTLALEEDGELAPVHGDFYRLVQILENLLSNAIKFTEPGGRIAIGFGHRGDRALVVVRDTGFGVPPEEQERLFERLFERLYRGPSAVTSHAQGAGLGLTIAKSLVEAHGGTIELESTVGVGTVVRVSIPYADPAAGQPVPRSE